MPTSRCLLSLSYAFGLTLSRLLALFLTLSLSFFVDICLVPPRPPAATPCRAPPHPPTPCHNAPGASIGSLHPPPGSDPAATPRAPAPARRRRQSPQHPARNTYLWTAATPAGIAKAERQLVIDVHPSNAERSELPCRCPNCHPTVNPATRPCPFMTHPYTPPWHAPHDTRTFF